jgi:transposase InsO family protein
MLINSVTFPSFILYTVKEGRRDLMKHEQQVVIKRWIPILEEYEKRLNKITPRAFKTAKALCEAHHISPKELRRYYRRWTTSKKDPLSLLPQKRGAKPGTRRTPKEIERNIIKAYRRFGSNRYELVQIFKPYYLDKTPSAATMDRIKCRYPLNPPQEKIVKRYEKKVPGELAHIDITKLPKDLRTQFRLRDSYVAALEDDCTRLAYAESLADKRSSTLTYFMARGLNWFRQLYGFEFKEVLSDNGPELKGTLEREHPFETFCEQLGIKHRYTRPYRPQTNGKVEAFFKILKKEFLRPNTFEDIAEVKEQLGGFLFDYNHLRRHGGLKYMTPFDKLETVTELLS